jgi:hypothetical protein
MITSSHATGQIITAVATEISDGDTFTLDDGFKQSTFEFDRDDGVTGTHIAIAFAANDEAATVASAIVTAIKAEHTVAITATLGTSDATVILTNDRATSHGNQTIGATGNIGASFQFTGMSGGQGGDCDPGVGCKTAYDWTSGVCTNDRCQ